MEIHCNWIDFNTEFQFFFPFDILAVSCVWNTRVPAAAHTPLSHEYAHFEESLKFPFSLRPTLLVPASASRAVHLHSIYQLSHNQWLRASSSSDKTSSSSLYMWLNNRQFTMTPQQQQQHRLLIESACQMNIFLCDDFRNSFFHYLLSHTPRAKPASQSAGYQLSPKIIIIMMMIIIIIVDARLNKCSGLNSRCRTNYLLIEFRITLSHFSDSPRALHAALLPWLGQMLLLLLLQS